jgi:hypothetical protein
VVDEVATFEIVLWDGQRGRTGHYVGGVLTLVCPCAFAPGQPMALHVSTAGEPLALVGKAAGSKRRADGSFDVRLRLHSLRREAREWLEAELTAR